MIAFILILRGVWRYLWVEKCAAQCGSWISCMDVTGEPIRNTELSPNSHLLLKENLFPMWLAWILIEKHWIRTFSGSIGTAQYGPSTWNICHLVCMHACVYVWIKRGTIINPIIDTCWMVGHVLLFCEHSESISSCVRAPLWLGTGLSMLTMLLNHCMAQGSLSLWWHINQVLLWGRFLPLAAISNWLGSWV